MGRGKGEAPAIDEVTRYSIDETVKDLEAAEQARIERLARQILLWALERTNQKANEKQVFEMMFESWEEMRALARQGNQHLRELLGMILNKRMSMSFKEERWLFEAMKQTRGTLGLTRLSVLFTGNSIDILHLRRDEQSKTTLCGFDIPEEFLSRSNVREIAYLPNGTSSRMVTCHRCCQAAEEEPQGSVLRRLGARESGYSDEEQQEMDMIKEQALDLMAELFEEEPPENTTQLKVALKRRAWKGLAEGVGQQTAKKLYALPAAARFDRLTFPYSNATSEPLALYRPLREQIIDCYGASEELQWPSEEELAQLIERAVLIAPGNLTFPDRISAAACEARISAYLLASLFPEAVAGLNQKLGQLITDSSLSAVWKEHFPELCSPSDERFDLIV